MPQGKFWNLAGQTVAIVASILLAFWIDAWWEGRQQQADERVVLESLLADLVQKKVIFERDRSYNETIYQATASLLMAATDSEKELSEDEVDKFINEFGFEHQETDWESAPLNSIFVASGSLKINLRD